jgi:hypothetical protein
MWEIASRWARTSTRPATERCGRRLLLSATLLWSLSASWGCHSDAERREQARVANLAARIDRLRQAANTDKRPLLEALQAAECVGAEACALKDLCVRAYQVHQRGLDAVARLKSELGPDQAPAAAQERMRTAQEDFARGRELGEQCAEAQVRAVRKVLM